MPNGYTTWQNWRENRNKSIAYVTSDTGVMSCQGISLLSAIPFISNRYEY